MAHTFTIRPFLKDGLWANKTNTINLTSLLEVLALVPVKIHEAPSIVFNWV